MAVTALEVADEDFLVASLIERCPKAMMIRELMKNALEAAQFAPEQGRLVEISAGVIDGAPKLCLWNTGPGMDAGELMRICNIASSIGKEKSLTGNFGMGAKVASLPSNQRGMRYRSCKDGKVHEVILCKRDGVYGRLRRHDLEFAEFAEVKFRLSERSSASAKSQRVRVATPSRRLLQLREADAQICCLSDPSWSMPEQATQ